LLYLADSMRFTLVIAAVAGLVSIAPDAAAQKLDVDAISVSLAPANVNLGNCDDETLRVGATAPISLGQTDTLSDWIIEVGESCDPDIETSTEAFCSPGDTLCCEILATGKMPVGVVTADIEASVVVSELVDCVPGEDPALTLGVKALTLWVKMEAIDHASSSVNEWTVKRVELAVDLVRPDAPQIIDVRAGESTASVKWNPVEGEALSGYQACAFTGPYDARIPLSSQGLSRKECAPRGAGTEASIIDLDVDVDYQVLVSSIDEAGNHSLPSDPWEFKTQEVMDFYEEYRGVGGGDPGGFCATAPGGGGSGLGWLAVLSLGLLLGLRRRLPAFLAVGALLVPAAAAAESPRSGSFELRFGNWTPAVDSEFSGGEAGPYERVFEDESISLMAMEASGYVYQGKPGTIGIGGGYFRGSVDGRGHAQDGSRSDETTTLGLNGFSAYLSYAMDYPADDWNFPVVPFVKLGVDWVIWEVLEGSGEVSKSTGGTKGEGLGATAGWHWSAGGRLLLDFLAPEMARTFDLDMGVNNSYLQVEYVSATIDDFGDENSLRLGDDTVLFGIVFDF
jgi:MYXO-CTERM domain-containing protein